MPATRIPAKRKPTTTGPSPSWSGSAAVRHLPSAGVCRTTAGQPVPRSNRALLDTFHESSTPSTSTTGTRIRRRRSTRSCKGYAESERGVPTDRPTIGRIDIDQEARSAGPSRRRFRRRPGEPTIQVSPSEPGVAGCGAPFGRIGSMPALSRLDMCAYSAHVPEIVLRCRHGKAT